MKIMGATAGLLAAAAIAGCGSSGPSSAYKDGYQTGAGAARSPSGAYTDPAFYCQTFSVTLSQGNQNDWIKGCVDGFTKNKK